MKARSSTEPAGARPPHFEETHVHAVMRGAPGTRATTKPLPASGCGTSSRGHVMAMLTVETYGTSSHSRDASGSTCQSSLAATYAGTARITARAVARAGPATTSHPRGSARRAVAGILSFSVSGGRRRSIAETSSPIPDERDLKTLSLRAACGVRLNARITLPRRVSASTSFGKSERIDRSSVRPA